MAHLTAAFEGRQQARVAVELGRQLRYSALDADAGVLINRSSLGLSRRCSRDLAGGGVLVSMMTEMFAEGPMSIGIGKATSEAPCTHLLETGPDHFDVENPEHVCQVVTDVGEIEECEWDADQSVEHRHKFAEIGPRRYVSVPCGGRERGE